MFEFFLAQKYLLPKRNAKTTLLALLSIGVISLVVCLSLVFLSVTSGLENRWAKNLVGLNAPLRITPTAAYYSSYYYSIDSYASASQYTLKTLDQKAKAETFDPYNSSLDPEIPYVLSRKKDNRDLVKNLYTILQKKFSSLRFEEYQITGALMKIHLLKKNIEDDFYSPESLQLSQVAYLLSCLTTSPQLPSLIIPPSLNDVQKIWRSIFFDLAELKTFLSEIEIKTIKPLSKNIKLPLIQLPKNRVFSAVLEKNQSIVLLQDQTNQVTYADRFGDLKWVNGAWRFFIKNQEAKILPIDSFVMVKTSTFDGKIDSKSLLVAQNPSEIFFNTQFVIQNETIQNIHFPITQCNIESFTFHPSENLGIPSYFAKKIKGQLYLPTRKDKQGILLPKALQESGATIGDVGTLSYSQTSLLGSTEQKIPFFVAGFYDPGIFPIGSRFLIVPKSITQTIYGAFATFIPDSTPANGIYLWPKENHFKNLNGYKIHLENELKQAGLSQYFRVDTYQDYEFAKAIFQQFQSDKTLFSVIALLILIVACSNIVSLLILLVNDKRKEIAILQAMGATKKEIARIFAIAGFFVGTVGTFLGIALASLTLHCLDSIVAFLSFLQGRNAFNPAFFGEHLPSTIQTDVLIYLLIATPLLSIFAGLLPALKACKMHPSSILKGES